MVTYNVGWAVAVPQLVEWSLLIPEIQQILFTINCAVKTKIKDKEAVNDGIQSWLTSGHIRFQTSGT